MGCSPWGRQESDTTERLPFHFSLSCIGVGNSNPLQCSCLENPRDGGAWWAAVYGVTQSRTWLKQLSSSRLITWRECCYHLKTWKRQFAALENRNRKWKAVPSPPRALRRVTSDAETLLCFFLVCTVSSLWCVASIFSSCGTGASLAVVHQLNCPTACGILYPPPRMELLCPPQWKMDSWPLDHQGNPRTLLFIPIYFLSNDSGSWSSSPSRLSNQTHIASSVKPSDVSPSMAEVFYQGWFCPPVNTGQCLELLWVVTTGGEATGI